MTVNKKQKEKAKANHNKKETKNKIHEIEKKAKNF